MYVNGNSNNSEIPIEWNEFSRGLSPSTEKSFLEQE